MKKKILLLLLSFILLFSFSSSAYASSTVSYTVPDFQAYAESSGYDVSNYPYYCIYAYEKSGYLWFRCIWESSNIIEIENGDTSGGSWSTVYYSGYHTIDNYVFIEIKTDMYGNYVSHSVTNSGASGTLYKYKPADSTYLYSNHNIIMKHTDNSVSTVFLQAPILQGAKTVIGGRISAQTVQQPLRRQILCLIPLVISLAIFSLALRKAFRLLVAKLRQA